MVGVRLQMERRVEEAKLFFVLRYELLAGKKGLEVGRVERRWTERASLRCGLYVRREKR